ncbi:MAG: xanthine dehydrogenase family protein subunit M, partial [Flavobacterium sp.]
MNNFQYLKSSSIDDAVNAITSNDKANFLAGGTNIIDLWKYNLTHPEVLVDINNLNDLADIRQLPDGG